MGHTVEVVDQTYNALIPLLGKKHLEKRSEGSLLASIEGMIEERWI